MSGTAAQISQTTERTLAKSDYPVMEVDLMARRSGEKYKEHFEEGFYCCAHCGARLFSSTEKFQASGRYPAFRKPIARSFLRFHEDFSYGTLRKTASCANCDLYLGMVLETVVDEQPTKYYGILSITLEFEPRANAGDAPTHIEEEESEEEEVVEPPRVVVAPKKTEPVQPAAEPVQAAPVQPKVVDDEEEKPTVQSTSLTPTTSTPTGEVSIGATLVKYAHIALFVAPLVAGFYQKYRNQSHS